MARHTMLLTSMMLILASFSARAQTTAGIGTTMVFPVIAQTSSFASEVTVFNPGPNALTAHVTFFEANNSSTPGTKVCTDASVPANRSVQFSIGAQCPLAAGSHFGLLVVSDSANPPSNSFYGYTRVQNPLGIGFSVEGFPVQNFNNQVSHAIGLKRQAASPAYQTNCFVGSLEQPVSYELKLFDDTTGAQIGGTLTGSLNAFEQYRYLDVFGPNGVNAPAGDQFNVRAQFTQTSGGTANLIGFCTVQDNTSFGADFRIAKSYGSPSSSFFAQGGNTFGTIAKLGTLDNQPLELYVHNQRALRYEPNVITPNAITGSSGNAITAGTVGASIGGGGANGNYVSIGGTSYDCGSSCANRVTDSWGTIAGGVANQAGSNSGPTGAAAFATVGGGIANVASGLQSAVAGGTNNAAKGAASTIAGGQQNVATGIWATVAGGASNQAMAELATVGGGAGNVAGFGATVAGGDNNSASGTYASIPGGQINIASGDFSFAFGQYVVADQPRCVVFGLWSGGGSAKCLGTTNVFKVMGNNGFSVDYHLPVSGGGDRWLAIGPFTHGLVPTTIVTWNGAYLSDAGVWVNASSSRASKTEFQPVDVDAVLRKLAQMPITTWRYRDGEGDVRHMGPMSEDFYAAFAVGYGSQTIADLDARGVAFAAIQGLNAKVDERNAALELELAAKEARIEAQARELEALKNRLARIESALTTQALTLPVGRYAP